MTHWIGPQQFVGMRGNVVPQDDDQFQHEFSGLCTGVRHGFLQVRDMDDEVYVVEVWQFTPDDRNQGASTKEKITAGTTASGEQVHCIPLLDRSELIAIREEHLAVTDEWGGEQGNAPRECSPRFVAVADGIQATVFDRLGHQDLFPTTTGNRSRECGIGTAAMIAEALNFHEANAGVSIPGGGQGNDSRECSVLSAVQAEIGEWARSGIEA